MASAYEATFRRLIQALNGRQAVIPLSGGHDSRLILHYLHKLGYRNILTYTYGRKDNEEAGISKRVAEYFGVSHKWVEFKRKELIRFNRKWFEEYALFSGRYVSVPHTQELYAVSYLKEKGLIDADGVIIPGFSGDYLAGSHLIADYIQASGYSKERLVHDITNKHFNMLNRRKRSSEVTLLYTHTVEELQYIKMIPKITTSGRAAEISERFNLMERQAKFIQNAVRTYEYYGYKWMTPLFEKAQFNAWMQIANEQRFERKLFFEFETKEYPPNLHHIPFAGGHGGRATVLGRLAKSLIPERKHYMNVQVPLLVYYFNLFVKLQVNINQYVKDKYLRIIKK